MSEVRVQIGREHRLYPSGTTIQQMLEQLGLLGEDTVAATLNNHVVGLATRLEGDASVVPVERSNPTARAVIRRSTCHVIHAALLDVRPELHLTVGQSMLGGYFYSVEGAHGASSGDLQGLASQLDERIRDLAALDQPFIHRSVPAEAAASLLTDPGGSKRVLLQAWASPSVPLVELGQFVDIRHGPYAPSTRVARGCRVVPFQTGIVLQFPDAPQVGSNGAVLWEGFRETREWNRRLGVVTVGDVNLVVLEDRVEDVMRVAEALHEKKIAKIADMVRATPSSGRVIFVSGPSCAGKTTFVRRLSVQLRVNGIDPVFIGLDDYYRPRSEYPLDDRGEVDFESVDALDIDLLRTQLGALTSGQEVAVPRFDFVRGVPHLRERWRPLKLREDQVLLVEGIHALNPRITEGVPSESGFRIFVNALTQLVIDEHNRNFTSDARLLRRIVRDRRYRGTSVADSIARWGSVRRGEDRNIFPFVEQADAMFNSVLVYETSVLKTFAWRYLLEVPREHASRTEAYRLLKFLDLFVPVFPDGVPANSVLREFIGGSGFSY